ncbi:MAG TPA: M28 family metallopeptidase [Solirubrobacteraceae bacterium]|nr:M28 family metallopeptidase [Solirubrobacteraceae bacterium]
MTSGRRTPVTVLAAAACVLSTWALAACGSDVAGAPATEPAIPQQATAATPAPVIRTPASGAPRATTNRFDGRRAFSLLREQVEDYGWRPAGSTALRRLAVRLRALMPAGRFEDVPGHPRLRNVVGGVPGRMPAIVVGAHYDVEATPAGFVGANDGAAGTAAVVMLARAFARSPRPRDARALRFVLFDGEEEPAGCEPFIECGLRGSKAYARRHAGETSALVLLDYIAERRGLRFTREEGSDAALWAQLRSAARSVGVGALFPNRTSGAVIDDHVPFTQRGVPAIDIIDFDYPQRDTLADDLDAVSQRSLDAVGEAVHRLVARLRLRG